jgi:hypothetical protein
MLCWKQYGTMRLLTSETLACHEQAEEDAAALRAEIKLLQASEDQSENLAAMAEQHRNAEQQNSTLQKELQVKLFKYNHDWFFPECQSVEIFLFACGFIGILVIFNTLQ